MGIVIGIDSRLLEFSGTEIVIGSSSAAHLPLPNDNRIADRHAVMRLVAGRWLIEAQGDAAIRVGDGRPGKVAWLNPGDVIQLSETGPTLTFSPPQSGGPPIGAPPQAQGHAPSQPTALIATMAGAVLVMALAVLLIAGRGSGNKSTETGGGSSVQEVKNDEKQKVLPLVPPTPPEPGGPSVADATYVVLLEDPAHERQMRHGMACAIGPRQLVTSGYSVALSLVRGRENSPIAKVQGREADQTYQIIDIQLDPKFVDLVSQVEQFQGQILKLVNEAEEIERGQDAQRKKQLPKINDDIRHIDAELQKFVPLIGGRDLAILVVDRDLPSWLATAAGDVSVKPGKTVSLVGFPWSESHKLHDPEEKLPLSKVEAQLSQKQEIQNVKPYLWLVRFGDITKQEGRATDIWSGSPVVDNKQRLIGVYSRTHPNLAQQAFDPEWHEVTSIDSLGDIKQSEPSK